MSSANGETKAIAMSWESITISIEPGMGRTKIFAKITSKKVMNIMTITAVSPIHSILLLKSCTKFSIFSSLLRPISVVFIGNPILKRGTLRNGPLRFLSATCLI